MSTEKIFHIPLPVDNVVLSDLDGTLIDKSYQLTSPGLVEATTRVQNEGWTLGLSSDTPHKALEVWRDRLNIQGPIIAEKGAVVEVERGLLYDRVEHNAFAETREEIERDLSNKGFVLWHGNPVEALRESISIGSSGEQIALINNLRLCSLGLFFRRVDRSGRLIIDPETTNMAMSDMRQFYPSFPVDEDFNEDLGLLIVAREGTNKRSGTQKFMQHEGLSEVGMVGDSIADYLGSDIAKHYAVANASSSYKEKADFVASQPITKGVIEIYNNIRG